jgi:hypothetical protein
VDYYDCLHSTTLDAIDHFCQVVKDESHGKLLTCVFYSYSPDLIWPQEGDHRAAAQAHRTRSIDIFSSPHSYERRKLGQDGLFRNYPAAIGLHGKLFIDEGDDRTSLANDPPFTHVKTIDQSIEVLRREFANAVTHGVGLWYMDQQNNWFHDPKIMADLTNLKKWANYSMSQPRQSVSEVAVISALKSEFYLAGRDSGRNNVTGPLYVGQVGELCRTGAPFDWYMIEDLEEGLIPPCKAYVFLDCFYLTPSQRKAIEKLKADHRTLIWFYAPRLRERRKAGHGRHDQTHRAVIGEDRQGQAGDYASAGDISRRTAEVRSGPGAVPHVRSFGSRLHRPGCV